MRLQQHQQSEVFNPINFQRNCFSHGLLYGVLIDQIFILSMSPKMEKIIKFCNYMKISTKRRAGGKQWVSIGLGPSICHLHKIHHSFSASLLFVYIHKSNRTCPNIDAISLRANTQTWQRSWLCHSLSFSFLFRNLWLLKHLWHSSSSSKNKLLRRRQQQQQSEWRKFYDNARDMTRLKKSIIFTLLYLCQKFLLLTIFFPATATISPMLLLLVSKWFTLLAG